VIRPSLTSFDVQAADNCLFSYDPTVLIDAAPLASKCVAILFPAAHFSDDQASYPLPARVAALSAHPSQLTDSSVSTPAYFTSPLDILHAVLRCARSEDHLAAKCAALSAAASVVHLQASDAAGPLLLQPVLDAVTSCFRAIMHAPLVLPCNQLRSLIHRHLQMLRNIIATAISLQNICRPITSRCCMPRVDILRHAPIRRPILSSFWQFGGSNCQAKGPLCCRCPCVPESRPHCRL
jgi:hypothetical protein